MSDLTQSADQVFISTLLANLQAGGVDSSRNLAPSTSAWQGRGHQLLDPRAQGSFEARPSSFQPHQSMNHVAPYSGSELAGLQTAGGSGRQAPPPADQGGRLSQLLQLLRQRQNGMQPTQPRPYSEAFEMSTMSAPGTSGPPPSNTHPSLSALTHAEHEILRQLSTLGGNRGPGVAYEQNPTVPLPAAPPPLEPFQHQFPARSCRRLCLRVYSGEVCPQAQMRTLLHLRQEVSLKFRAQATWRGLQWHWVHFRLLAPRLGSARRGCCFPPHRASTAFRDLQKLRRGAAATAMARTLNWCMPARKIERCGHYAA